MKVDPTLIRPVGPLDILALEVKGAIANFHRQSQAIDDLSFFLLGGRMTFVIRHDLDRRSPLATRNRQLAGPCLDASVRHSSGGEGLTFRQKRLCSRRHQATTES